jgi:hypothetical protein
MTAKPAEFRDKVRDRYDQAMAQIEPIIGIAARNTRIARADPEHIAEIHDLLKTVVTIYTAKCGPLDTGSAAWLMLKAIRETLKQEP